MTWGTCTRPTSAQEAATARECSSTSWATAQPRNLNPPTTRPQEPSQEHPRDPQRLPRAEKLDSRNFASSLKRKELVKKCKIRNLLDKIRNLPDNHHLNPLGHQQCRPRLRSRGESHFRKDWRTECDKRLSLVDPGACVRHSLREDTEKKDMGYYLETTSEDSLHRRATGGVPATQPRHYSISRTEEVAFHRMRINRAPWTQQTPFRFGRAESDACLRCGMTTDDTEHMFLRCTHWEEERRASLGQDHDITTLQDMEKTINYLRRTGVLTPADHWSAPSKHTHTHTHESQGVPRT